MSQSKPKLLVIDDDQELCHLLVDYLTQEGFEVTAEHDGEAGVQAISHRTPDLVILDVMLPRQNGIDVLKSVRRASTVPVIMLTARREDSDRIVGLELGADDYVPKPCNPRELTARIRAVLRRMQPQQSTQQIWQFDDLLLDYGSKTVRRGETLISITPVEFDLLAMLTRYAGQVIERDRLFRDVLDRPPEPLDRTVDVHISNLRRKLGPDDSGANRIKSIRGVGYMYTYPSRVAGSVE